MTQRQPYGQRRSWDYPDCPHCETDVLVDTYTGPTGHGTGDYECLDCGARFDVGDD